MNSEIIHSYQLDIKQDFPEELKLAEAQCDSLERTNKVFMGTLIVIGIGLSIYLIRKFINVEEDKK